MRSYNRRSHRAYLNAERARHQIERAVTMPECPRCKHAVRSHALEDGERVCTHGPGLVSCRDCALLLATLSKPAIAMHDLAAALRMPPSPKSWQPLVLTGPATGMPKSQAAVTMSRSLAFAHSHSSR